MRRDADGPQRRRQTGAGHSLCRRRPCCRGRAVACDHQHGRVDFGGARRVRRADIADQAVTVIEQHVRVVGEARRLAALARQPRVGIGRRLVRVVAAASRPRKSTVGLLPPPSARRRVLRPDALVTRPRLQQRAVDREVLVRQQPGRVGLARHRIEEARGNLALQQPRAILGERRRHPEVGVHRQADEPAKQQVVLELLDQHPLAADRVQHLQQQRAQQLLGRHRRAPRARIQRIERGAQLAQRRVGHPSNRAQRMLGGHPLLRRQVAEEMPALFVVTTHDGDAKTRGSACRSPRLSFSARMRQLAFGVRRSTLLDSMLRASRRPAAPTLASLAGRSTPPFRAERRRSSTASTRAPALFRAAA